MSTNGIHSIEKNSIEKNSIVVVDEVVKFYEENIGIISPYIFEVLDSYRDTFSDDVIIYAMQKSVDANARNINYIKAILNNWKNKGIKLLIEAKNESVKKEIPTKQISEDERRWQEFCKQQKEKEVQENDTR